MHPDNPALHTMHCLLMHVTVKLFGRFIHLRYVHVQTLAWLSIKVAQAKRALESQLSGMEESDKDAYVCGLLSDYLTPSW
jgi:hypothetical protein